MRSIARSALLIATISALGAFAACVGDDPGAGSDPNDSGTSPSGGDSSADSTTTSDGGTDGSSVPDDASADASTNVDAGGDAGPACSKTAAFGALVPVGGINSASAETGFTMTSDGLNVVFGRFDGATTTLYKAKRATASGAFSVTGVALTGAAANPSLSADGLTVYFDRNATNNSQLHYATRASVDDAFGAAALVPGPVGTANPRYQPYLAAPGVLYYIEAQTASNNAFLRTIAGATPVEQVVAGYHQRNPIVTADDLEMFYSEDANPSAKFKVHHLKRAFPNAVWQQDPLGTNGAVLASAGNAYPVAVSPDGCTLYVAGDAFPGGSGGYDIFATTRGK